MQSLRYSRLMLGLILFSAPVGSQAQTWSGQTLVLRGHA
jgi:hypothetical protein